MSLQSSFPGAVSVEDYVKRTYDACLSQGLTAGRALALVGLCRDELSDALADPIRATWGSPFRMSGLAGMLFLGQAGLRAAQGHAPDGDRRQYIVYAMPHIGVDDDGRVGYVRRPHQGVPTTACGALMGVRALLETGATSGDIDPDDLELSLLRQRVQRALPSGGVPDIAELTTIVRDVILDDLTGTIERMGGWADDDLAVFSGIHIHTADGDYVQPGRSWVRLAGAGDHPVEI